jgi:hypothetical protein
MKRQWQIQRTLRELPDGSKRWDQAYRLALETAGAIEQSQTKQEQEENHANSDLCSCFDSKASAKPDN